MDEIIDAFYEHVRRYRHHVKVINGAGADDLKPYWFLVSDLPDRQLRWHVEEEDKQIQMCVYTIARNNGFCFKLRSTLARWKWWWYSCGFSSVIVKVRMFFVTDRVPIHPRIPFFHGRPRVVRYFIRSFWRMMGQSGNTTCCLAKWSAY